MLPIEIIAEIFERYIEGVAREDSSAPDALSAVRLSCLEGRAAVARYSLARLNSSRQVCYELGFAQRSDFYAACRAGDLAPRTRTTAGARPRWAP